MREEDLKAKIRVIPDFPQPGVSFKDITTLLQDGPAFREAVKSLAQRVRGHEADLVVGVESRGFLIGAPVAYELGIGVAVIRKPGKLPGETVRVTYEKEYGPDVLELRRDAITAGQRILLIDDLLATGGTMSAAAELVRRLGGEIAGFGFLAELTFLNGRERLGGFPVVSLIRYDD